MQEDSSTMNITSSDENQIAQFHNPIHEVYLNDLVMSSIIQFVPHMDRENIELTSSRMYNLSSKTPCLTGNKFVLHLCSTEKDHKRSYGILLQRFKDCITSYSLNKIVYKTQSCCSANNLELVLERYSRRFKKEIVKVEVEMKLDAYMLHLLDEFFPNLNFLRCPFFDEDCLEYLTSKEQTITKKIRRLEITFPHKPKNLEIIATFKHLRELIFCNSNEEHPTSELLKNLDDLIRHDRQIESWKSKRTSTVLPHLSIFLRLLFSSTLLTTIATITNLTHLDISFKNVSVSDAIIFFEAFNVHKLKYVLLEDVMFDRDLLKILAPTEKSNIIQYSLNRWIRIDNSNIPLATILPHSLKSLIIHSQLTLQDLEIIKDCQFLERLHFIPVLETYDDCEQMAKYFQRNLRKLKKLKEFCTCLYFNPEFLISLWASSGINCRFGSFNLVEVNEKVFEDIYLKLYKKKPIRQKEILNQKEFAYYNITLDFPLPSEISSQINYKSLFKNSMFDTSTLILIILLIPLLILIHSGLVGTASGTFQELF